MADWCMHTLPEITLVVPHTVLGSVCVCVCPRQNLLTKNNCCILALIENADLQSRWKVTEGVHGKCIIHQRSYQQAFLH